MICLNCGAEMETTDSFCPSCGKPVKTNEPKSVDFQIRAEEIMKEDIMRREALYNIEAPAAMLEDKPVKVKRKHFPIKIVGIVSIFLLIAGFFGYLALCTNFFAKDEDLIKERLNVFVEGINEGNIGKIESCLDKAQRGAAESVPEEGKAILEGILNFGDLIEKIPGVNISPDDKYTVKVDKINNISINGDVAEVIADVKVKIAIFPEKELIATVTLVKEKEGAFTHNWYIADITTEEKEESVVL